MAPAQKRTSPGVLISVAVAIVALLATAGVAVWNFVAAPVPAVVVDPTPTVTAGPQPSGDPTPDQTADPTPTAPPTTEPPPSPPPPPPPPAAFPAGARPCAASTGPVGGFASSAAGNDVTSCPFAEEVRKSYGANPVRNAPVVIPAYSPVTGVTYEMRCTGERLVSCTGGNNAVVYLI